MTTLEWEVIEDTRADANLGGMVVERAKVPSGWLVRTHGDRQGGQTLYPSICYVPDPFYWWAEKPLRVEPPIIPHDPERCQAEKPHGNSFMTLGGRRGLVRCYAKPAWLATENEAGPDLKRGSMSLCHDCYNQMVKQGADKGVTIQPLALPGGGI